MLKKIIWNLLTIFIIIHLLFINAGYSQKQEVFVGTIDNNTEMHGNTYLSFSLIVSDNLKIPIWCSSGKTKVYFSDKEVGWSGLDAGRKIKIFGDWIESEGEKLIHADRIELFGTRLLQSDPITILPGDSKNGVKFSPDGTIYYYGTFIEKWPYEPDNSKIILSQPSPKKGYVLVLCWDYDYGGVKGFIVNSLNRKLACKNIIPKNSRIIDWVKWSPAEDYALIAITGEVTMGDMAFIDLNTGKMKEIHYDDYTNNNQGKMKNLQECDYENRHYRK